MPGQGPLRPASLVRGTPRVRRLASLHPVGSTFPPDDPVASIPPPDRPVRPRRCKSIPRVRTSYTPSTAAPKAPPLLGAATVHRCLRHDFTALRTPSRIYAAPKAPPSVFRSGVCQTLVGTFRRESGKRHLSQVFSRTPSRILASGLLQSLGL